MAKLPGGLGRGLDSLLSGSIEDGQGDRLAVAAVGDIRPGRYQPRVQMETKPCTSWPNPSGRRASSSRLSCANTACRNTN